MGASVAIAGGTTISAGSANHPGIVTQRSHATNANSGAAWGIAPNALLLAGGESVEVVFRVDRLTDVTAYLGFQDSFAVAAPTDGAFVKIPSTGALIGQTSAASVTSSTATIATVSIGTWYRALIEVNATATSVTFSLYSEAGALLGSASLTTNIPTVAGQETGVITTTTLAIAAGSAVDLLSLDYVGVAIDRTLVR